MSAETQLQIETSSLQEFVETKLHLEETKTKLESLELEAIDEALTLLCQNQEMNKNNVIFENCQAKVVVGFRQKYESSKENKKIAQLEDEIRMAEEVQNRKIAAKLREIDEAIQELENQLIELQEKREKLMETQRLKRLKAQHFAAIQESGYKQPYLSVHIKR